MTNNTQSGAAAPTNAAPADYHRIGCGCCTGNYSQRKDGALADDRCTCWMHQDAPRGLPPRTCSVHARRTP